ncbi:MAG TPA: phenylacetate--CoA ligase family protein [Candidatus Krumholzibacteria bacterium]|nr:phenylacetate--CoA ligase family protein [Candidatus Krumholzibacteria bacterium]HPD72021.1 phenylacetate--CoA ligase family protein [Candidatus Krumholzibacteria bacterium]HRY41046.1 phenylacetate--CoA ligase family protein [Candidatus Krumholzibacteria bacterium]
MNPGTLFARHVLFPLQCRREHNHIPSYLRDLERSQWLEPAELAELQVRRLRELLTHAGMQSIYWRRVFAEAGFDPAGVRDVTDLRRLPTLDKRGLQSHHEEMRAPGHAGRLIPDKTGGSTGEPVRFDLDERRFYYRRAVEIRHDRWTGWDVGDKAAYFWGHRRDVARPASRLTRLRLKVMDRRIVLDTSSITADAMERFRRRLLEHDPAIYVGYANALYLYARFLQKRGGDYQRPRSIVSSAEFLAPERREVIESVFGCRVYDRYGSRETGLVASECGRGDAMHVAGESVLVEILRPDGAAASPGERGRVVVTDLMNHGMPLIRYEIRDMAEAVAVTCACGRGLPRLRMAGGRVTDFLLARDGRIVSGASLTIFLAANAPGVAQAQLVQRTRDEVRIRVVPGEGYGPQTREWLLRELPRYFGEEMSFGVDEVAEIPLAASGKHRFSVCELDPTELF